METQCSQLRHVMILVLCVFVCLLRVYTPPQAIWLKSEEFQMTDFSETEKLEHFLLISGLLAFTIHPCVRALIAHAHALASCTHDINPASVVPFQQC